MRDPLLAEHGTKAFAIKPGSIVQGAVNDLKTRDSASHRAAQGRKYLFAWSHVSRAKNARDLIRRAIASPGSGTGARDLNTRDIYRNPDLLRAALDLCPPDPPEAKAK